MVHWDRHRALAPTWERDSATRSLLDSRRAALEHRNVELELWRCPEVYLWTERLWSSTTEAAFQEAITHLDVLMELTPLPPIAATPLFRGRGVVYQWSTSGWAQPVPSPVRRLAGGQHLYYPSGDLFTDLFEYSKIDTGQPSPPCAADRRWLDGYMSMAIHLIQAYSADLAADFTDAVAAVVLLASHCEFHSGNFGLRYYGGVFVSPYSHNECSGAAALIHEYIHLCHWLLWTFVEPEGRPDDRVRVRSPITGNEVDAFSLCDAMMIYASNCDFYAWTAVSSDAPNRLKEWAVTRYRALARHLPGLHETLTELVPAGTRYRRYINHSMQCFQSTVRLYGAL